MVEWGFSGIIITLGGFEWIYEEWGGLCLSDFNSL